MCESNVYLADSEGERLVMEDAVALENLAGKVKVTNVLGEVQQFEGEVEEITFLDHKIIIRA